MTFLDFFSGIGGFRLGMEQAGHECLGHCEIDKYANISYEAIHKPKGSEFFATDIRGIEPGDLPEADCFCGGFPCQSFSIAGKRGGFEDTRGTLFFEVMRLAKERKPSVLFLENVAGLLNHDNGDTFETIIRTMDELGYDVEWQVLNSKDYGVPQNRERVFIIGHLRGTSGRKVFPIRESGESLNINITGTTAPKQRTIGQRDIVYGTDGIITCLQATDYKQPKQIIVEQPAQEIDKFADRVVKCIKEAIREVDEVGIKQVNNPTHSNDRVYQTDGVSPCLNTMQGGNRQPFIVQPVLTPDRPTAQDRHGVMIIDDTQGFDGVREYNEVAPTVRSQRHGLKTIQNARIRRLTPLECWRLQGYPDWAYEAAVKAGVSDSQRYKQAGNSVTVNVIYEIAKKLFQVDSFLPETDLKQ